MPENDSDKGIVMPIDWHIPDDLQSRYATHMAVQHMEHEFLISFFELRPPMIIGQPEETLEKLKQLKSMQANCVSQIIVSDEKMPQFVKVLQDSVNRLFTSNTKE